MEITPTLRKPLRIFNTKSSFKVLKTTLEIFSYFCKLPSFPLMYIQLNIVIGVN